MYLNSDKRHRENTSIVANSTGNGGKDCVQLKDNRPKSAEREKLTAALNTNRPIKQFKNNTGLPDKLKAGIENASGMPMDDVKVHYNSHKPAQLQALAYATGADIHIGPGQEKHLPHEAWHVVQQKQGRVKPTTQLKEQNINNDAGLEKEADVMGLKAMSASSVTQTIQKVKIENTANTEEVIQAKPYQILDANPVKSGKAEVTIGGGEIKISGNVTTKASGAKEAITGGVTLSLYHMPADRNQLPVPIHIDQAPDAMRVKNLTAEPKKLRLGQLITYHLGLEAQKHHIPYVIAMTVSGARGPFYTPLGFTDYNAAQPYQNLIASKLELDNFIRTKAGTPMLPEELLPELVHKSGQLGQLLETTNNMVIPTGTLIANSLTAWQQVWSVDAAEEDSRRRVAEHNISPARLQEDASKARGMENAYHF